ncbi:MAG: type II secretion system GspH family protein [Oscillospiraceae bacterium]|nr:type II secretion system GspH family protein [Oscillospiraceae bacterium]
MKKLKNKQGFSLVEILVVIALIAVSVGVIGVSVASLSASNLRKCTYAFDNMLSKVRVNSLYRAEPVYVEFSVYGRNVLAKYYEDGVLVEEKIMGRADYDITYKIGDITHDLSERPVSISFVRGKGALILVDEKGEKIDGECKEFRFSNGTVNYVINITPSTGNRRVRAG